MYEYDNVTASPPKHSRFCNIKIGCDKAEAGKVKGEAYIQTCVMLNLRRKQQTKQKQIPVFVQM